MTVQFCFSHVCFVGCTCIGDYTSRVRHLRALRYSMLSHSRWIVTFYFLSICAIHLKSLEPIKGGKPLISTLYVSELPIFLRKTPHFPSSFKLSMRHLCTLLLLLSLISSEYSEWKSPFLRLKFQDSAVLQDISPFSSENHLILQVLSSFPSLCFVHLLLFRFFRFREER